MGTLALTVAGRGSRIAGPALLLVVILGAAIVASTLVGSTHVSWRDALAGDVTARAILFDVRLPRVLLAALVGAILAVSGATFQTLLRNPLADPFILGVSGGAAAGAATATAFGLARVPGVVPVIAFCGACGATAAVFLLARRREYTDPTRLLLSGLVLNAFFSAIILISFALSRTSDLTAALRWMMGTLFGATWSDVVLLSVLLVVATMTLAAIANDLRMLVFGEDDAKSMRQAAGTMMACPEGMETEKRFLEALNQVSRWKITAGQLLLSDPSGNAVSGFEARHMK